MAKKKRRRVNSINRTTSASNGNRVVRRKRRVRFKRKKLKFKEKLAVIALNIILIISLGTVYILNSVINDPDAMTYSKDGLTMISNSRIYDTNGNLVCELGEEIRQDVTYDQLPQSVIDAFLSIEDSRFFDHNGFDLPRFISAAINNLKDGGFSQGGSTLTMQMIDNAFTSNQEDKMISEQGYISKVDQVKLKIQEIYLSLIAEQSMDKKAIFEYYVNRVWFGSGGNTRGIEKAAQYYFNKDVTQLNVGEAAFLAGTVNAPNEYNPILNTTDADFDHLTAGEERRNVTLDLMYSHGYITKEERDLYENISLADTLEYTSVSSSDDPNEAYVTQVIDEVKELTGQDPSIVPMDIYTALNTDVQKQCDEICRGNVIAYPDDYFDVGMAVLDNTTGEIIAVGPGRTYHTDDVKVDNSLDRKQPGSSMKPVLAYSSTFDILGWSTEHAITDEKKDFWKNGTYVHNSDGKFNGEVSLAYALGVSKNTCAASAMLDLIDATSTDYWVQFLKDCGYDDDVAENFNEQYAIGGSNMWASPVQQASAYTMFANQGSREDAHRVRKVIRRSDGEETDTDVESHKLISKGAAFMTSYLLYKVVNGDYWTYNMRLKEEGVPIYGKSGTSDWGDAGEQYGIPTSSIRDMWSIGYTSQFTIAVWSGYTKTGFEQGYYIPTDNTHDYAMAFDICNNLLDFCAQFGTYTEIPVTDDVSQYEGGYILTKYLAQGDKTTTSEGTPVDENADEKKDEDSNKTDDSQSTDSSTTETAQTTETPQESSGESDEQISGEG